MTIGMSFDDGLGRRTRPASGRHKQHLRFAGHLEIVELNRGFRDRAPCDHDSVIAQDERVAIGDATRLLGLHELPFCWQEQARELHLT